MIAAIAEWRPREPGSNNIARAIPQIQHGGCESSTPTSFEACFLVIMGVFWPRRRLERRRTHWALSIYEKKPEISVAAKVEFPIGKKLLHLVVNLGTWPGARPWTWNWYKLQETSMEHDIPFGNSNRENGTTFFDFPLFLGIFQWDEPTKRVPFTAEAEIPEILTKWKAPIFRT